ncbi:MAG: hypothetical protein K6C94_04465 [Candidatus Gastranaerophilales bacterium]|nr:hypothetical protein [Candidatus Gastranaerophilales bacterium]
MKKLFILLLIIFVFEPVVSANHLYPEKYYQTEWCGKWNGKQEYKLKDSTRVDCLTKNYAVEFDFAPKWAESVGQSLYYAKMTKKHPAVILIIEKPADWKYYHRLNKIAADYNITVWYMKSPAYDDKGKGGSKQKTDFDAVKVVSDFVDNLFDMIKLYF